MRKIVNEDRGVSVIIGALMLVVITVSAAVAFAAFVSQQQANYQQSQTLAQQTELERLVVTKIGFDSSGFVNSSTIQNTGVNDANIWSFQINDNNVYNCNVSGSPKLLDGTDVINVGSLGKIVVDNFTLTNPVNNSGPITIKVWTKLKTHEKTFYPPVALIQIDTSVTPLVCDGTKSYCITDNAYILQWHWTITDNGAPIPISNPDQPKVNIPPFVSGHTYVFNLTVYDNFGMTASDIYTFTQP